MYSTARLEFTVGNGIRAGTGFFFDFFDQDGRAITALVSNQHVFGDSDVGLFRVTKQNSDGLPDTGNIINLQITNLKQTVLRHPEVDLAIYPLGGILPQAEIDRLKPFIVPLHPSLIPTPEQFKALVPIENILTVGYPGMFWDNVNNVPLFHRGSTASAPYLDFKGKQEFVIDIATWPGSSGSPVFIFDEGAIYDERTNATNIGRRIMLIGIVYGVAEQEVDGEVVLKPAPTTVQVTPLTSASMVPTNLGACIRSTRLLEFEPLLASRGAVVPRGYKMRAVK